MTDKQTEALRLALEALENSRSLEPVDVQWVKGKRHAAITAIREALAQSRSDEEQPACEHEWLRGACLRCGQSIEQPAQQQEPVAWKCECGANLYIGADGEPRSKSQQQEPLTQDMVESCPYHGETLRGAFFDGWIKAEAAHGIKGDA